MPHTSGIPTIFLRPLTVPVSLLHSGNCQLRLCTEATKESTGSHLNNWVIYFQNLLWFSNVIHYTCNFFVRNWSSAMNICSTLWLLMTWCFSICGVATDCHQVCFMFWGAVGHLSPLHRGRFCSKWYKMICMGDLPYRFILVKSTDTFSIHFNNPFHYTITASFPQRTLLFLYLWI